MLWRYYDNMLSRFNRIPERYGRTDGQTDGRTENCCINTRVNLLTRDKKGSRDPNDATFGGKFLFMGYIFEACTLENIVTLKSGLALIQGRWNWYRSKAWMWFPIRIVTMTIFSRFDTIYERDRQTARQQRTTPVVALCNLMLQSRDKQQMHTAKCREWEHVDLLLSYVTFNHSSLFPMCNSSMSSSTCT